MVRIHSLRERLHVEEEFSIVEPFQGKVLRPCRMSFDPVNRNDHTSVIRAFRLDSVVDEGPEGYARGAAHLIAGIRLRMHANRMPEYWLTFIAGIVNQRFYVDAIDDHDPNLRPRAELIDGEKISDDLPAMRHGTLLLEKDIQVPARARWPIEVTYNGPDVPLAFARIIAIGVRTRDVQ